MSHPRKLMIVPILVALAALAQGCAPDAERARPEAVRLALTAYAPSVAVVLCEETYDTSPRLSQMSSQALVGLAGLVGVPYDTLTLDQLLELPAGTHASLWLSRCSVLSDGKLADLAELLSDHLAQGGSVLLDGPLGIHGPPPAGSDDVTHRGSGDTEEILGVRSLGWAAVAGFTVRTAPGSHPLSSRPGWGPGTTLTQGLAEGTDLVGLTNAARPGSHTLLELADGSSRQPYLVAISGAGRVLAISGFGHDAGAASPFRNHAPRGFFDNLLLPRLIDAASWLLSGGGPTVGLQLSHAPLTAVVRLDGDVSDSPSSTAQTLDYLVQLARQTGVTTAYGIVSRFAESVGWQGFSSARMQELESLGGAIASHSGSHPMDMSAQLVGPGWDAEVRGSMSTIREHFQDDGFQPPVQVFINPGNTIGWRDYRRFFKDVRAYFTHGFELSVPYTSGISGFDLPAGTAPVALFGNTPVPDYHWFYDPDWTYGAAQAAELQRKILGYFQGRVGRGALYNQMWHDYGLAGHPPDHDPEAGSFQVHYDAVRDHFSTERVYAPAIDEVTTKLHIAQRSRFTAQWNGDATVVTVRLDLSRLSSEERGHLAGMGLRVDRPGAAIVGVEVDGTAHPAFTADTVILPPATSASAEVEVTLGAAGAAVGPRLTYLSKAPRLLVAQRGGLRLELARSGLQTRFCLVPPSRHVVIGADRYAPDGPETCGRIDHGAPAAAVEARALDAPAELSIVAADRRIVAQRSTDGGLELDVAAGSSQDRLTFRASRAPDAVQIGEDAAPVVQVNGAYTITLGTSGATTVRFEL
jgi:hypothetical protein